MSEVAYPYDPTGVALSNLVTREPHVLTEINSASKRTLIPVHSPFYQNNFLLEYKDTNGNFSPLAAVTDYDLSLRYVGASVSLGKNIFGGITVHREFLDGMIYITYQTIGGTWTADRNIVLENLASLVYNPRIATWDQLTNVPAVFPPTPHSQELLQFRGLEDLIESVDKISQGLSVPVPPSLLYQEETLRLLTAFELLKTRVETLEEEVALLKTQIVSP